MGSSSSNHSENHNSQRYALIVDDDPGILAVYDLAFSDLGFKPIVTTDACVAIEKVREYSPAIILLDNRMPEITGLELARRIRQTGAETTPIVMVSASRYLTAEALDAGVSACLEKPFDVNDLIEIIEDYTKDRWSALSA